MTWLRRTIAAAALLAGLLSPFATFSQAPPPVPALPDTERRTSYSISGTTCACAVNFALYGDGTDYQNWIEVWLNGVRVNFNDLAFGWTVTSPTGPLATIPRPVTDAVLTFNNVQTGTVQIVGSRRPRRTTQLQENRGVAARDVNQAITDLIAQNRETWDRTNDITGRGLFTQPGNTMKVLPPPTSCVNDILSFGPDGLTPTCMPNTGSGTVTSITAGCGTTTFGAAITNAGTISTLEGVNLQSGTSYAIQNSDCGSLTDFNNSGAVAVTIAQAGVGNNFVTGWFNDVCNLGAGAVTITPTVSTINGISTLVMATGRCNRIISDGINYQVVTYGAASGGAGTPGGTNTQAQYNNAASFGGSSGITMNSTVATLANIAMGLGSDAKGDTYYNNGTANALARLGIGTNGQCLTVSAGLPAWGACGVSTAGGSSGQLQWNNGGVLAGISGATTNGTAVTFASSDLQMTGSVSGTVTFNAPATGGGNITLPAGSVTLAALSVAQTWIAAQTFNNSDIKLLGSSTGATTLTSANSGASNFTLTVPAVTDTLATIGTAQTWTAAQTFTNSDIKLLGSSTGATTLTSANAGASNFTITLPAVTDTVAVLGTADQTVSGGANVTTQALSTGNITIDCGSRPLQSITNGGAFTITAPAADGSCLLLITNNASAGAVSFSGFSVGSNTGDALTTTNTNKFTVDIWRISGISGYRIAAHQ